MQPDNHAPAMTTTETALRLDEIRKTMTRDLPHYEGCSAVERNAECDCQCPDDMRWLIGQVVKDDLCTACGCVRPAHGDDNDEGICPHNCTGWFV
jgi:hypothetical protein